MSHCPEIKMLTNENWVFKSEKYSLSSDSVLNKFKHFWREGTLCDVDLVSGDRVVKAHRVVLAATCVYFKTMFKSGFEESHKKCVTLPSIPPDVLPLVVEFIYTGQTVISGPTVFHLIDAAHMLQLENLSSGCVQYLRKQVHTSNVLGIISFAETYNLEDLAEEGLTYAKKHWKAVAASEEFLSVPFPLLMKLLASKNLAAEDELQVLHAVLNWLDHDPASRRQYCIEVMRQMRLREVSPQMFEDAVKSVRDPAILEMLNWFIVALSALQRESRLDAKSYLYVIGGNCTKSTDVLNTAMKFDGKVWTQIAPMSVPRREVGVAALVGLVYAVGGRNDDGPLASGEVYDPSADTWTPIAPMRTARYDFGLAAINNKLYAFGGAGRAMDSSIEAYDPTTNEWTVVGEMPERRWGMSVVTYGGAIYTVGGRTPGEKYSNTVLRYAPGRAEWRTLSPVLPGCDGGHTRAAGAAVDGPDLYIVGGLTENYEPINTIRCYNLETEESHVIGHLLESRSYCVAGVLDGVLVAAGGDGHSSDKQTGTVEMYDLAKRESSTGPSLPEARLFAGVVVAIV